MDLYSFTPVWMTLSIFQGQKGITKMNLKVLIYSSCSCQVWFESCVNVTCRETKPCAYGGKESKCHVYCVYVVEKNQSAVRCCCWICLTPSCSLRRPRSQEGDRREEGDSLMTHFHHRKDLAFGCSAV